MRRQYRCTATIPARVLRSQGENEKSYRIGYKNRKSISYIETNLSVSYLYYYVECHCNGDWTIFIIYCYKPLQWTREIYLKLTLLFFRRFSINFFFFYYKLIYIKITIVDTKIIFRNKTQVKLMNIIQSFNEMRKNYTKKRIHCFIK